MRSSYVRYGVQARPGQSVPQAWHWSENGHGPGNSTWMLHCGTFTNLRSRIAKNSDMAWRYLPCAAYRCIDGLLLGNPLMQSIYPKVLRLLAHIFIVRAPATGWCLAGARYSCARRRAWWARFPRGSRRSENMKGRLIPIVSA